MIERTETIVALEHKFWDAMREKDVRRAGALIAQSGFFIGAQGATRINPAKYEHMTHHGTWTLESYQFSEVDVVFPAEDVAVIAYQVHQTGTMNGQPMDMDCVDSTTWVRDQGAWKCALHTEVIRDGSES